MAFTECGDTINTFIVFCTVGGVFMLEATILAGALNTRCLGRLLNFSLWALYLEGVVALLNTGS